MTSKFAQEMVSAANTSGIEIKDVLERDYHTTGDTETAQQLRLALMSLKRQPAIYKLDAGYIIMVALPLGEMEQHEFDLDQAEQAAQCIDECMDRMQERRAKINNPKDVLMSTLNELYK